MVRPATPQDGCAWITGASSGLGRSLALRLATQGWHVVASARRQSELDALAAEAEGGRITSWALDVVDADAVTAAVDGIESAHGPIALAVLNAGTHQPMTAQEFDRAVVERLMRLNVVGAANCIDPLLPRMRARGHGQVALVASVAGYRGLPTAAAYSASKAAAIAMAESLRPELEPDGVLMQVVNPGFIKTPLTDKNDFPMPMLMDVEDATTKLVAGLGRTRFEIVFPRLFCWIVKLYRCMPYALAMRVARGMRKRT
jgi:NAD(P)-dependent dehydrogenase (short-subunit alcohol dehydrogenase family)